MALASMQSRLVSQHKFIHSPSSQIDVGTVRVAQVDTVINDMQHLPPQANWY